MLLHVCVSLALLQDPAPAPDPGQDAMELMRQVLALMEDVREGFRKTDLALQEARTAADQLAEDDAPVREKLQSAVGEADALLGKIEELLQKLPVQESQQQQSSSSSQQQQQQRPQQDQRQRPAQPQDQRGQPHDNRDSASQEQRPALSPPPDSPRIPFLFDPRYGAWGELPVRLQSALENATAEELPLRYRRWLEEYYRRSADG
ncbi:MAG: hypothetical protein EYC70_06805 [Planctomycetota bacterium]|nr:MAG: hypothetical protein EYC70_06805 [Planctomycetota bacterium]